MIQRRTYLLAISVCVAAISFAAGRLLPRSSTPAAAATAHEPRAEEPPAPSQTALIVPQRVPNVTEMPFSDTYALLKAASSEILRSYYGQLVSLRPKPTRHAALVTFFKTLVHVNPALTKELILGLKGDDRWAAMFAIRDAAPPRGMHAVAEVLLSFDRAQISSCSWDMLADYIDEWGKNDPSAVKQFLETHRDRDVERYYPKLVRNWAAYDPEAARQWAFEQVQSHPPPPEDDQYLGDGWTATAAQMLVSWVEGYLEYDPDAAIDYVFEQANNERMSEYMYSVAAKVFTVSPDRARELLLRLPDEERSQALIGIGNEANRSVRTGAHDHIIWPRFVTEWMMQFPVDNWKGSIHAPLREWKYSDAQELFTWMTQLPADKRETIIQQFPTYVSKEKPTADFELIMQARDPVLRDQLLEQLARDAISDEQRETLLGVLENAQLPPAQKLHLAGLIPLPREERADASAAATE